MIKSVHLFLVDKFSGYMVGGLWLHGRLLAHLFLVDEFSGFVVGCLWLHGGLSVVIWSIISDFCVDLIYNGICDGTHYIISFINKKIEECSLQGPDKT